MTTTDLPLIRTLGLTKLYRPGDHPVAALDGIDLDLDATDFTAIVGASGSGKSTLLNLLAGLDRPTHGTVQVAGRDLARLDAAGLAEYRLKTVGMIFQSFNLIASMTAAENVELPLTFAGMDRTERRRKAADVLNRVGLSDRMGHRPAELSGGEQQRVAVARALVADPAILLADEPTGNLDSRTAAEIMSLLVDLHRSGKPVVMITHDLELAERVATRQIRLLDGRVATDSRQPTMALAEATR